METFIHRDQNFRIVLLRNRVFHEINFVRNHRSRKKLILDEKYHSGSATSDGTANGARVPEPPPLRPSPLSPPLLHFVEGYKVPRSRFLDKYRVRASSIRG